MDLEQQLRAALAPCRPGPALRTNVIARVSAGVRTVRGRASARLVLVGMVLAVAAAALMLAASLTRTPAPSAAATATVQVPVANPLSAPGLGAPVVATSPAPAAAAPRPQRVPVQVERQEAASIKPFTVMVLPIENASTEVAVTSAVDTFYRTLLDGLRATPGLMLITPESEEVAARTPADYRLTMKGTGSTQANTFTITLKAAKVGSFVQPYQIIGTIVDEYMLSGTIPPECAATPGCGDAIGMAARQLQLLRDTVFPESPARAQQMRARLVDPELGAQARLDALLALESLRGDDVLSPARPQSAAGRAALRDPAVVRGAIALAAAATQDFVRAQVWKKMRGVGSAELVQPLIAAARTDSSRNVRAEAVMTLAADFAGEPRARDALEALARQDAQPLVRVLAQSGLAGKDGWPRHLVAALTDSNLTDLERIEALYYVMNQDQAKPGLREVLADDESIRAFAQVLPGAVRAAAASPEDMAKANALTTVLVSRLESIDHAAITDMLLDAWEHPWVPDQFHILNQLARRSADPRVRALLEKISTGTANSPLREIARNALNKAAAPPAR